MSLLNDLFNGGHGSQAYGTPVTNGAGDGDKGRQIDKYRGGGCLRKAIPLIVGLIALGSAATGVAAADGRYPSGPVHLIVPFAAGGAVDIVGRLVGQQLSKALGQPVIVENVTGAGGTIAATRVARASPDGYTILVGNLGTQIASIGSFKNLPYNPRTDFAPVMIGPRQMAH